MEENKNLVPQQQNQMAVTESNAQMIARVKGRIQTLQAIFREIMVMGKDGSDGDYGIIPGCGDKPALKKAGAEKIIMAFRVSPTVGENIKIREYDNGHREVTVVCTLTGFGGEVLGEGVGSCSTLESKYRYRNVADYELTGEPIPKDSKEKKTEYRKKGFGMKKVDGVWEWVKYTDSSRQENLDIADIYNTVLKMSKKRALIDAVLTVFGASDLFTQDIDEALDGEPPAPAPAKPAPGPVNGNVITEAQIKTMCDLFKATAQNSPLIKSQYEDCLHEYAGEVLSKKIMSVKVLTKDEGARIIDIMTKAPDTVKNKISAYLDSLQESKIVV